MTAPCYILTFFIGTIIGSFLNVCIYRIPRNLSIVYPRSHCPQCTATINWYDLIPVLSYIFLQGKCRHCHHSISIKYCFFEILTGLSFLMATWHIGLSIELLRAYIFISFLIVVAAIDYEHMLIFDSVLLAMFIGGLLLHIILPFSIINIISGVLAGLVIMGFIIICSRGKMGTGDMLYAAVLGSWFGLQYILQVLWLTFVIGGSIALILLLSGKAKDKPIGLAPFISAAALIVYVRLL